MPEDEEAFISSDLQSCLECLEERTLDTYIKRMQSYSSISSNLGKDGADLNVDTVKRLLNVCVDDLQESVKFGPHILKIISILIIKTKEEHYTPPPDFVPSMLVILEVLNTAPGGLKNVLLQCFEVLMSFPAETVTAVCTFHYQQIFEVCKSYCNTLITKLTDLRVKPVLMVYKFLKTLSTDKRKEFVKKGIDIWFSKFIPIVVIEYVDDCNKSYIEEVWDCLDILAKDLVTCDYSNNMHWEAVFSCIHNEKKYPNIMKKNVQEGKPHWDKMWIVFIRLLKSDVTRATSSQPSPINSMLPIIEVAFKMDPLTRCKALECWNALIDNFSSETNDSVLNKRLNLLSIPLKLNNAKVEITALKKIKTWMHYIKTFENKLDKFYNVILIPFLHFSFGKPSATSAPVPGFISDNVKRQCFLTFVHISGHIDCEGCVDYPKFNTSVINTSRLVNYWSDLLHSLHVAMKTAMHDTGICEQHVKCLWKSQVSLLCQLPENNVRKDLFNDLLSILDKFLEEDDISGQNATIMFNVLIVSLFTEEKFKTLLKLGDEEGSAHKVIQIMLKPKFGCLYNRYEAADLLEKFKMISDFIVNAPNTTKTIEWLLDNMPANDNMLLLWTAIAESLYDAREKQTPLYNALLQWPLKGHKSFFEMSHSAKTWYLTYEYANPKPCLLIEGDDFKRHPYFFLHVTIAIIKHGLTAKGSKCTNFVKEVVMIRDIISSESNGTKIQDMIPVLIDTLVIIIGKLVKTINIAFTNHTIIIVKQMLRLMVTILKSKNDVKHYVICVEKLFKSACDLFKVDVYSYLKYVLIDELIEVAVCLSNEKSFKNVAVSTMKTLQIKCDETDETFVKLNKAIQAIQGGGTKESVAPSNKDGNKSTEKDFIEPPVRRSAKKKKEAVIVNTVVENGEEYVVVKSNWKFNAKNLTENQKEKFQRKREDIPALYQDLSQSQDEFKLQQWKTDSQDTSVTSSSASTSKTGNEDNSAILKNMPSTEVVPKIMEAIMSEQNKSTVDGKKTDSSPATKPVTTPQTPRDPKSPRVALKDRVFRNVRNLIEKSSLQSKDDLNVKDVKVHLVKCNTTNLNLTISDNIPKTPEGKVSTVAAVSSAPPKISADRPSRVKRKPKKFDDTQLFALKKGRLSTELGDATQDDDNIADTTLENDIKEINNVEISVPSDKPVECSAPAVETEKTGTDTEHDSEEQEEEAPPVLEISTTAQVHNDTSDTTKTHLHEEKKETNAPEVTREIKDKPDNLNDVENKIDISDSPPIVKDIPASEEITQTTHLDKPIDHSTPSNKTTKDAGKQKSTAKKSTAKKSRIEKELAIDMVEGHPFLTESTVKRTRRRLLAENNRRANLAEKLNKSKKSTTKTPAKQEKKSKDATKNTTVDESQCSDISEDIPQSEDIIESSQDSTFTSMSVKSTRKKPVSVSTPNSNTKVTRKREANKDSIINDSVNAQTKEDIELSRNKTAVEPAENLTECMDTEPMKDSSSDVIIINDDKESPIVINSDETCLLESTQEIADADTQPMDPNTFNENKPVTVAPTIVEIDLSSDQEDSITKQPTDAKKTSLPNATQDDITRTFSEADISAKLNDNNNDVSSPFKDEENRKKDFLNNTLEISPIKSMSPVRESKSPSPETSNDFVVIKLTSPVQSNGEPFGKCDSPEIFTEDKVSPDKRDLSPPREPVSINNSSPSSSLSLKKNRPQVRSGGRAAHMLGLCVPEKHNIMNADRPEVEEPKKNSTPNTPARRNLRILYNTVGESNENSDESEDNENFLKLKRLLPSSDCSPVGPILKRKLADITDEATISPASKRKRVSFQDPPVSTTVTVQKYIEPLGLRSPQNTMLKRLERQDKRNASGTPKSAKKLDNVFKLDTVLTKAVESFTDIDVSLSNTEDVILTTDSMDVTPIVEIVKTSDLNNTDPICPELVDCKDSIDNIAQMLSSPTMKDLLTKELDGKVETVGDLARLTELEVNRLCIRAPKVKVAKKVLAEYVATIMVPQVLEADELMVEEVLPSTVNVEIQTNELVCNDVKTQTVALRLATVASQTEAVTTASNSAQTLESGRKSTTDLLTECFAERPDFIENLNERLEEKHRRELAEKLPLSAVTEMLTQKMTSADGTNVLDALLKHTSTLESKEDTTCLQDYLCKKLDSKNLVLFCSQLLKRAHDNL